MFKCICEYCPNYYDEVGCLGECDMNTSTIEVVEADDDEERGIV